MNETKMKGDYNLELSISVILWSFLTSHKMDCKLLNMSPV